ncbi:MAG: zinc ribbon domain-containing protein [Anaerolineales bacterium]|nr:zinc ribbon domain-containing protein [Anaerolineales bacterium]
MPIYEYTCKECCKDFETIRSMNKADAPIECQFCGGQQVNRKVSACYAKNNDGGSLAGMSSGCGSCAGGNCGSCAIK